MKVQVSESSTNSSRHDLQLSKELVQEILRAISGIRYGSVEITVHDSRVVQIERKEKVRIPQEGQGR